MSKVYWVLCISMLLGSSAFASDSCADFTGIWSVWSQVPAPKPTAAKGDGVLTIVQNGCTSYGLTAFNDNGILFHYDNKINFSQLYVVSYTDYDHGYYTITTLNGDQLIENFYYGGGVHQAEEGFLVGHAAIIPAEPHPGDKLLRSTIYTLVADHPRWDGTMTRVELDYEKGTFIFTTYHKNSGSGVWF